MFSKNLKYYRLKISMTKKRLASLCGLSPMAITNYENGSRYPDKIEIIQTLADTLGIKVSDFLARRSSELIFHHGEFRKNQSLSKGNQEYIREAVEEYFSRFFNILDIIDDYRLPTPPKLHFLPLDDDIEKNAAALRRHLKFAKEGPVENLTGSLENKGILLYKHKEHRFENGDFSAINGTVNGHPYIVFNGNMTSERSRSDIAHELAHIFFKWPSDLDDKEQETLATAISGAFLCPKSDMLRELGLKRKAVAKDILLVCKEYGVSSFLLVKRAEICNIINESTAENFFINASKAGWRKNEPTRIKPEEPILFQQLVCRTVSESEISIQKGAELLKSSYEEVKEQCYFEQWN